MTKTPYNNERPQPLKEVVIANWIKLRKILSTFIQCLKNVKLVVDDYYSAGTKYSRPFSYALAIIAPIVLSIQLLNYSPGTVAWKEGYRDASRNFNIEGEDYRSAKDIRLEEIRISIIQYAEEFLPIVYALIIAPIYGLWLKVFFGSKRRTFSFYYALSIYILMTAESISIVFMPFDLWDLPTYYIYESFFIIYSSVSLYKTFKGNMISAIVKSILIIPITLISLVIILVPTQMVISEIIYNLTLE